MASGLVWYVLSQEDVDTLARIGAGRRVGLLPVAAGEEYSAIVVRSPTQEHPGNQGWADLLVFVDGTQPFFVRDRDTAVGTPGHWSTTRSATEVG